jgi:hypothetical protein
MNQSRNDSEWRHGARAVALDRAHAAKRPKSKSLPGAAANRDLV